MRSCFQVSIVISLLIAAHTSLVEPRAWGDPPLAWSFVTDQELPYEISQQMTQQLTLVVGGEVAGQQATQEELQLSADWKLSIVWRVREVNDEGTATLEQFVKRIVLRMTSPGLTVEFDTGAKEDATGPAAMLSPLMSALVQHPLVFSATSGGQVESLEIPEPVAAALKNSPGAATWHAWTEPGLRMLLRQVLLPLPPRGVELEEGYAWQEDVELAPVSWKLGDDGAATVSTVVLLGYRYAGRRDEGGSPLAVFVPEITLSFPPSAGITVESQSTRGQLLFDVEAGRLQSAEVVRNLVLSRDEDDRSLQQLIEQTSNVRWLGS